MAERSWLWEWVTYPVRRLRWRSSGWSTGDDRAFHDSLFQAAAYDPFSPSYPGYVSIRRFADHAAGRLNGVDHAVDLGCGPGEITCELARRFPEKRFTGIDHSDVALGRAAANAARLGLSNVEFVRGDLESFVPRPGTGIVMMFDAFHHVLDPAAFLARVRDVCPRLFLIEPAGMWTGSWDRRGDMDWLAATLLQIRERLEAQFGLTDDVVRAVDGRERSDPPAAGPTEHRYTLSDFQRFFDGFGVEMRGTIAGLELYGGRPYDRSPFRSDIGQLVYETVARVEDLLFGHGVDLAAKHWAIYAERGAVSHWPEARLRRARVAPQPAAGLLPAYALQCGRVSAPEQVASGQTFAASVTMKNAGWQRWDSAAAPPMFASYHWKDAKGAAVVYDGVRTALPKAVEPGDSVTVEVQVHAPAQPGQYRLSLDLVHESVTWLSDQGCVFPEQLIHVV